MKKKEPLAGVNLVDPRSVGATAEQKDYLRRKDALLKETQMLERKYNIRLGAEIRYGPTGIQVVMVTYDIKGKRVEQKLPN